MPEDYKRPVGLTKDVGYQIGVRRTLSITYDEAWRLLTSNRGIPIWLGSTSEVELAKGVRYQLSDGTKGEVTVYAPASHLRLTWHPPDWQKASTIQLRVIPREARTVIAFHQEHLPDPKAREERRSFFTAALDELERVISSNQGTNSL